MTLYIYQIGIARTTGPEIDWQDDYVEAETKSEATEKAIMKGYYRNLRLIEIGNWDEP